MKLQDTDRIAAAIYEAPLGHYIGRAGAEILASRVCSVRQLRDKEFLYHKDEVCGSFYLVLDGRLALMREKEVNRPERIMHVAEKGDLVGELSFIDQTPHHISVCALGDASVLCFDAEGWESLITEHPVLIYNFMRAIIKRVHGIVSAVGTQQAELEQYISTGGSGRS